MDLRSLTESQGLTPTSAIEKETQKTEIKGGEKKSLVGVKNQKICYAC